MKSSQSPPIQGSLVPSVQPEPPSGDLGHLSDGVLVSRSRSGDALAWTELDHRHRSWAVHRARSKLRYRGAITAEEVAHDAMTKAYLKLDRHDAVRPFRPWLAVLINREIADRLRTQGRLRSRGGYVAAASSPAALDVLLAEEEGAEMMRSFHSAVRGLPPRDRSLFIGFYCDGASVGSLASVSGLAVQTVRARLGHAKRVVLAQLGTVILTNGEMKRLACSSQCAMNPTFWE